MRGEGGRRKKRRKCISAAGTMSTHAQQFLREESECVQTPCVCAIRTHCWSSAAPIGSDVLWYPLFFVTASNVSIIYSNVCHLQFYHRVCSLLLHWPRDCRIARLFLFFSTRKRLPILPDVRTYPRLSTSSIPLQGLTQAAMITRCANVTTNRNWLMIIDYPFTDSLQTR